MDFFNFSFKGLWNRARRKGRKGNLFTSKWEKAMNKKEIEEELEENYNSENIETETNSSDNNENQNGQSEHSEQNEQSEQSEHSKHPLTFIISFLILLSIMLWAAYNQQSGI